MSTCDGCKYQGRVFEHLAGFRNIPVWRDCMYPVPFYITPQVVPQVNRACKVREECMPSNVEFPKHSWQAEVIPMLRAGKKLLAIKLCCNLIGVTLSEAKTLIEDLMEQIK